MKKVIFEMWAEMLSDPAERPDYTRNDFINEAMEWIELKSEEYQEEAREILNRLYDEFRNA